MVISIIPTGLSPFWSSHSSRKKQTALSFVKTLRLYFDRKCFASCNFSFFQSTSNKKNRPKNKNNTPGSFFQKLAPRKMVGWDWKMIQSLLVGWLTNHQVTTTIYPPPELRLSSSVNSTGASTSSGASASASAVAVADSASASAVSSSPRRPGFDVKMWWKSEKCHLKLVVVDVVVVVVVVVVDVVVVVVVDVVVVVVVVDVVVVVVVVDVFDRMFERKWAFMLLCTQCKFTDAFMMFERLIDVFMIIDGWFDDASLKHLGIVYIYICSKRFVDLSPTRWWIIALWSEKGSHRQTEYFWYEQSTPCEGPSKNRSSISNTCDFQSKVGFWCYWVHSCSPIAKCIT